MEPSGLGGWIEPCRILLEHFPGIEHIIESPDQPPSQTALAAMRTAIEQAERLGQTCICGQLSYLPLLEYRVAARFEIRHPFRESLVRFHLRYCGKVHFRRAWQGYPSPDRVTAWLSRWLR